MSITPRGRGFMADFTFRGTRYREHFTDYTEAQMWEEDARLALSRGQDVPIPGRKVAKRAAKLSTLGEMFDHVRETEWAGAKAERDLVRNGEAAVKHFGRYRRVAEITKLDIDLWIAELKKGRNSGGTINRKLAALSKLLTAAVDAEVIVSKPKIKRQKEAEGRLRWITVEEEQAITRLLRQWAHEHDADLVEFLVDTGLRIGEALDMVWSWDRVHYVEVIGAPDRRQDTSGSKSGRTRQVPLTARARALLANLRIVHPRGPFREITYQAFRHRYDRVLEHLGLDEDAVCIHTLRHTTASRLVMRGVDLYRVMKMLGHANIKTTQRYAHLAPDSLSGLADVLDDYAPPVVPIESKRETG